MKMGTHDTDTRILVVAEIGNNHEGSVTAAEELVGRAAEAGADVVKFQTIVPERLVASSETQRREQLRRLCLTYDDFRRLAAVAMREGIAFLSTPFDLESVAFLDPLVSAFKIASGDHTCPPLLRAVAATGKPIMCSTGFGSLESIAAAKQCIEAEWEVRGLRSEIAFLHCVASYPVSPEQANLRAIATLAAAFPSCTIGYSDHVTGVDAAVAAAAIGARIIEKHFTLDHHTSDFRDHQLSADPEELRELVARVRAVEEMRGTGEKILQPGEHAIARASQRSLAAARDLPEGHVITSSDLTVLRPACGIPASAFDVVVGQRLTRRVGAGEVLMTEMVRDAVLFSSSVPR
ncbi:MAG: N-acetylneuraminate synthase family protein [bacterium]|nr:N-acetylneuraminate synthase family protein [bacterium]